MEALPAWAPFACRSKPAVFVVLALAKQARTV